MSGIPTFFMAVLLLFSEVPVSFAQQNPIQAQAKADAIRDADHDMKKTWWFMSGLVSSSVGCAAGGIGGCLFGMFIDAGSDTNCIGSDRAMLSCSILFGVLAVPAAVFILPHNPNPPLERLLGKPPEYIEAYTQVYRSKTISLRRKMITAGSLTSNLCMGAMLLLDNMTNR